MCFGSVSVPQDAADSWPTGKVRTTELLKALKQHNTWHWASWYLAVSGYSRRFKRLRRMLSTFKKRRSPSTMWRICVRVCRSVEPSSSLLALDNRGGPISAFAIMQSNLSPKLWRWKQFSQFSCTLLRNIWQGTTSSLSMTQSASPWWPTCWLGIGWMCCGSPRALRQSVTDRRSGLGSTIQCRVCANASYRGGVELPLPSTPPT